MSADVGAGGTERNMDMPKGRTVGIMVLAMVVIVLLTALILPRFVDTNRYHKQVQAQLERSLGRKVSLDNMHLSLFPPSFRAENAIIGEDPRFNTGNPFATAEKMKVSVRLWPLLRNQVAMKSIELDRPRIELVKDQQGDWNFNSLGHKSNAASQKRAPDQLELEHVLITDGQVAVTDRQRHQPRAVYDHIDLDVSDFAADRQFSIKISALLPGAVKQAVLLEGKAGPIHGDAAKTPFEGRLHLDQVPTPAIAAFLNIQALTAIEAVVSGEAKVKNTDGKVDSRGTIRLDDLHVHNVNVGYPVTLNYDVLDDNSTDLVQIRHADAKLGSTPVTLEGWLSTRATPATMDLKLTTENAAIGEAVRLASALGIGLIPGTDVTGQMNVNVEIRGPADHPIFNGRASARDLAISNKSLGQPVQVNSIELQLTPDAVRSSGFTAVCGSTSVLGKFAVSQYISPNSSINASLRAPHARLEEVLSIANALGIPAANGVGGEGGLSFDVQIEGPARKLAPLTIAGKGKLENATLKLPSLAKPLQIHHSDIIFTADSTALQNLSVTAGQTNLKGSLTLKDLAAPKVQFTLRADKANVADLQQFFGPPAAEPAAATHDSSESAPQSDASLLSRATGGGAITFEAIQYDNLTLSNVRSTVALDRGLIQMNPITADLFGGKQSGAITIDVRPAQPVYSLKLTADKVDANKLLSSVSSLNGILYGQLGANVNGTFSSSSAEAIARGMNGNMELTLTGGRLMNLDLLHELSTVGKFAKPLSDKSKNSTSLSQFSGDFTLKDGVARTTNLKAAIDGGTLVANGVVNLAEESVNLHITVVLNNSLSEQAGGGQVGGFMNTALVNSQHELVMPVIVNGTLQHPQVAPDVEQIAQMKNRKLLPTTSNPSEFTSGLVEEAAPASAKGRPVVARGAVNTNNKRRRPRSSAVVAAKKESPSASAAQKK
jgi:uncharacterized protein involved in outer membrane biogenesis